MTMKFLLYKHHKQCNNLFMHVILLQDQPILIFDSIMTFVRCCCLGCLMTPGLSKDIRVMYDHTFLNLQITRSDIRPHMK